MADNAPLDSAAYGKLKDIFSTALDLPPADRGAFLDAHCADANIRREVDSLLAANLAANQFLNDISAADVVRGALPDSNIDSVVDQYKIVRQIGRGGMGVVYLAERTDFRQQVAIKIIRPGVDFAAVVERFEREREILATLNHPFIARLLDGGRTNDGLPFFVMEYVDGLPLDDYCRRHDLDENARLELFRKICAAVQFAHQNLIVHRDLKPSNILVTAEGTPKLLDFGIAKLIGGTARNETQTQQRILTPAYASPEQIRGEFAGTTSDVYSLGVILSDMFDLQVVRGSAESLANPAAPTAEPRRASTRKVKSELVNIASMALRDDSSRRYGSCEALAADVGRFMDGLPVLARKDSVAYRTRKFVLRNRIGVASVAVMVILIATGVFAVWRQARIAEQERAKAERRAENLRVLSSSFAVELHDAILNLPGSLPARELLLTRAVEQLDALAADSDGNPQLQDELAKGYFNLSRLPNIKLDRVDENIAKGLAIYEKLLSVDPRNSDFRTQLANGLDLESNVRHVRGDTTGGITLLRRAVATMETVVADDPDDWKHRSFLFELESEAAGSLLVTGRARESLEASRRVGELGREIVETGHAEDDFARIFDVLHAGEGKSLIYLGDYQAASDILRSDVRLIEEQAAIHPNDTRFRYTLWAYDLILATALERGGETVGAFENLKTALALIDGLRLSSPDDAGYQRNTSYTYSTLGQFLVRRGRASEAMPQLRQALEMSEKIHSVDAEKGETDQDLARIHASLGQAFVILQHDREGLSHFRQAIEFFESGNRRDPDNARFTSDFSEALEQLSALLAQSNPTESRELLQRGYELLLPMRQNETLSAFDNLIFERIRTRLNP